MKTATVGGVSSQDAYDGDGKRFSQTVGAATTRYVYDTNKCLPRVLDDGTRKYVWGMGLAYSVDGGGAIEVYHADGLDSVRALTTAAGVVVQTYQTDEFGIATQTTGSSPQPFQYTGEQRDAATGFSYLRARMYEPAVGRFVQRDPTLGDVAQPSTLHRYAYVLNNPVNLTDPSGFGAQKPFDAGPDACVYYDEQCQRDPSDKYACDAGQCCREFGESPERNCVRGCLIERDKEQCAGLPGGVRVVPPLPPIPPFPPGTTIDPRSACRWRAHVECWRQCGLLEAPPLSCFYIFKYLPVAPIYTP